MWYKMGLIVMLLFYFSFCGLRTKYRPWVNAVSLSQITIRRNPEHINGQQTVEALTWS